MEYVALPLAVKAELPSEVVPSINLTVPVGVPALTGLTVAVKVSMADVELPVRAVAVAPPETTCETADDVLPLSIEAPP